MTDNTAPCISERYASATETSDMRIQLDRINPGDLIIAAAFSGEQAGGVFARLRTEFDQARAEVRHDSAAPVAIAKGEVDKYIKAKLAELIVDGLYRVNDGRIIREQGGKFTIEGISFTDERMTVMTKLKSREAAKAEVRRMAASRAERRGADFGDHLRDLAWQALSVWLDPRCSPCGGRGFNGGFGVPKIMCKHCEGSTSRRDAIGKTQAEGAFIRALVGDIEEALQRFESGMLRAIRDN